MMPRGHILRPLPERFWEKVNKNGPVMPGMDTPCWEWVAALNNKGYGVIRVGQRNEYAHRLAYEMQHGPIPEGMRVLHRCDHPPCVRHLFAGSMKDNTQDMIRKGRHSHGAKHGALVSAGRKKARA